MNKPHIKRKEELEKIEMLVSCLVDRLQPNRYSSVIVKVHDGRIKYEIRDSYETLEQMKTAV